MATDWGNGRPSRAAHLMASFSMENLEEPKKPLISFLFSKKKTSYGLLRRVLYHIMMARDN